METLGDFQDDFVVYGLLDPANGQLRYVGCSSRIDDRFRHHLVVTDGSPKALWVHELIGRKQEPKITILETFKSPESMAEGEKRLILRYKSLGYDLLNCREGGGSMGALKDESEKKTESLLVRVEKDVHDFFSEEARKRRISVSQVVRELLYREFEEKKGKSNGHV